MTINFQNKELRGSHFKEDIEMKIQLVRDGIVINKSDTVQREFENLQKLIEDIPTMLLTEYEDILALENLQVQLHQEIYQMPTDHPHISPKAELPVATPKTTAKAPVGIKNYQSNTCWGNVLLHLFHNLSGEAKKNFNKYSGFNNLMQEFETAQKAGSVLSDNFGKKLRELVKETNSGYVDAAEHIFNVLDKIGLKCFPKENFNFSDEKELETLLGDFSHEDLIFQVQQHEYSERQYTIKNSIQNVPDVFSNKNVNYRLETAVIYEGASNKGHYVALIRKGEKWFLANDSTVTGVVDPTPYFAKATIFHYKKTDAPVRSFPVIKNEKPSETCTNFLPYAVSIVAFVMFLTNII